jgi:Holliday junction resolvasome RuvABC endonuclease subunit
MDLFGNEETPKKKKGTSKKKKPDTKTEEVERVKLPSNVLKEQVLALDIATITGFACHVSSGVWDLTPRRDESKGMRLIRFRAKVKELVETLGIKLIVFERTSGQYKNSIIVQAELHGVLKTFCEDKEIDYVAYSAKEIKKFATGNGNANKEMMIQAALLNYGKDVQDDNEADALHIYHLTIRNLQL